MLEVVSIWIGCVLITICAVMAILTGVLIGSLFIESNRKFSFNSILVGVLNALLFFYLPGASLYHLWYLNSFPPFFLSFIGYLTIVILTLVLLKIQLE